MGIKVIAVALLAALSALYGSLLVQALVAGGLVVYVDEMAKDRALP